MGDERAAIGSNVLQDFSRRRLLESAGCALALGPASAAIVKTDVTKLPPYGSSTLPSGIRSRMVGGMNGLSMHILEAGFEEQGRPALLLLHGFPELAYSWRKVMLPLAAEGFYVVAPD